MTHSEWFLLSTKTSFNESFSKYILGFKIQIWIWKTILLKNLDTDTGEYSIIRHFFGNHFDIKPLKNYSKILSFEIRHIFVANTTVRMSNILCRFKSNNIHHAWINKKLPNTYNKRIKNTNIWFLTTFSKTITIKLLSW